MCFLTGCQNSEQKAAETATTNLTNQETTNAKQDQALGTKTLGPTTNYLTDLLSGNMTDIMQAIQPQVASLTSQYSNAEKAADEFSPRGGGRTATLANLPMEKANQVTNLIGEARSGAATELGNLGLGELSASTGAAEAGISAANSLAEQGNTLQQQQQSAGEGIGSLIATLVTAV